MRFPIELSEEAGMMGSAARSLVGLSLLVGILYGAPAEAGPTDTPLPTFSDGKPAVAVYTAVGVIKNNNLETDFLCTNLDSAPRNIGLEVFDETGALRNAVNAGTGEFLNVPPGGTVTVGTSGTAVLHEDKTLSPLNGAGTGVNNLRNGSGRVVATSKNVSCTATVVDKFHVIVDPAVSGNVPPPAMTNLPLIPVP